MKDSHFTAPGTSAENNLFVIQGAPSGIDPVEIDNIPAEVNISEIVPVQSPQVSLSGESSIINLTPDYTKLDYSKFNCVFNTNKKSKI